MLLTTLLLVSDHPNTTLKFDNTVYNGKLSLQNLKPDLSFDPILLLVTPTSDKVEVSVSKGEYLVIVNIVYK